MQLALPALARQPVPAACRRRDAAGFTLIEIMAVVVIMGMLMTMVAFGIAGQLESARNSAAKGKITRIEQALDFYQLDNARFPTTEQGLSSLTNEPTSPPAPRNYRPGGYIKQDGLLDPWDQPFEYRMPGEQNPHSFDVWSLGPDGQQSEDDITNWATSESA